MLLALDGLYDVVLYRSREGLHFLLKIPLNAPHYIVDIHGAWVKVGHSRIDGIGDFGVECGVSRLCALIADVILLHQHDDDTGNAGRLLLKMGNVKRLKVSVPFTDRGGDGYFLVVPARDAEIAMAALRKVKSARTAQLEAGRDFYGAAIELEKDRPEVGLALAPLFDVVVVSERIEFQF